MTEHARNQSQLAAMDVEVEQAKNELVEEKSLMFALLEELQKLKLAAQI